MHIQKRPITKRPKLKTAHAQNGHHETAQPQNDPCRKTYPKFSTVGCFVPWVVLSLGRFMPWVVMSLGHCFGRLSLGRFVIDRFYVYQVRYQYLQYIQYSTAIPPVSMYVYVG